MKQCSFLKIAPFNRNIIVQNSNGNRLEKRMTIFVSYHHVDEVFAKDFTNWLKNTFNNLRVFSTSLPMSVRPGQWFNEIVANASCTDMIFLFIGPDSIDYRWMLFEAGITASDK